MVAHPDYKSLWLRLGNVFLNMTPRPYAPPTTNSQENWTLPPRTLFRNWLSMVAHVCKPSTLVTGARELQVWDHPGMQSETLGAGDRGNRRERKRRGEGRSRLEYGGKSGRRYLHTTYAIKLNIQNLKGALRIQWQNLGTQQQKSRVLFKHSVYTMDCLQTRRRMETLGLQENGSYYTN